MNLKHIKPDDEKEFSKLFSKITTEVSNWSSYEDAFYIVESLKQVEKIKGVVAEAGVCEGATAKLICEFKKNKELYLFDTFEGLPKQKECDDKKYFEGRFNTPLEQVKAYLKDYNKVVFVKGLIPASFKKFKKLKFSFVNLDLDLYEGTKHSLKFFYKRLLKGGIILVHDYRQSKGIKKAIKEFKKNNKVFSLPLSSNQIMIVKL